MSEVIGCIKHPNSQIQSNSSKMVRYSVCEKSPPPLSSVVCRTIKRRADVQRQRSLVADAAGSCELVATVSHPAGHKLYSSLAAERSFTCLRRLKTFLRSTVSQQRLNHIALLHCHRDQTADLVEICNTFIVKNEMKRKTFSTFPKTTQSS